MRLTMIIMWLLLSTRVAWMQTEHQMSCNESPKHNLLSTIVGPMMGNTPAWMVDDGSGWSRGPFKTLWVLVRNSYQVRISGHQLDGQGIAMLSRGDGSPTDMLIVTDPTKESVTPGGASRDIMDAYVFLPSQVRYPNPGCWEFTIRTGEQVSHVVRLLKP